MDVVVVAPGGLLGVQRAPLPVVREGESLVRIEYGGICGSDLHYWRHGAAGESILRAPMILGHEVAGTVAVASADGRGPGEGDAVTIHPAVSIRSAAAESSPRSGYLGSAAVSPHIDGAFARFIAVPSSMLRLIPSGVDLRDAALAEPASVAWHAVQKAGDIAGRRIVVIGCGPIGLLIIALLRRAGATDVAAVDLRPEALERARASGAADTILASHVDGLSESFDVTFESSGSVAGLRTAVDAARPGARVVMVGLLPPGEQPVHVAAAIRKELELVGSFRFHDEIRDVLDALADGSLSVEGIVTHEFDVSDTLAAFETAYDSRVSGKVLLRFSGSR